MEERQRGVMDGERVKEKEMSDWRDERGMGRHRGVEGGKTDEDGGKTDEDVGKTGKK